MLFFHNNLPLLLTFYLQYLIFESLFNLVIKLCLGSFKDSFSLENILVDYVKSIHSIELVDREDVASIDQHLVGFALNYQVLPINFYDYLLEEPQVVYACQSPDDCFEVPCQIENVGCDVVQVLAIHRVEGYFY